MRARTRALLLLLVAALLAATLPPAIGATTPSDGTSNDGSYEATKHLDRQYFSDGQPAHDDRDVTVKVDRTTELRARERIHVSWSGAHPSGGRAANPFGENGMQQEYPVMVMECRGTDDPTLPADQQLSPDTCWTSTWGQRTVRLPTASAVWSKDAYATDAERGRISGVAEEPADCPTLPSSFSTHVTPFDAADSADGTKGTVYSGCSSTTMPPEAAVGAADPPNEIEGFTSLDGTGSADFEVRTDAENQSLGCSHTVACSLVVVPIEGISCIDTSFSCNSTGVFAPGSNNFGNEGVAQAVSAALWWSASNWRNRFSVPLSFGLPPSVCNLLGTGTPVPFYGSALLGQAALQWSPAYCLNKSRFNWQDNAMPDDAAYTLMTSGVSVAAEVTGPRDQSSTDPVGFAPTAVTGYGIAFDIDKPDNGGQQQSLKLNARLLAKLLTESYPASTMGQAHPGLGNNPISMNLDPEFEKLNPGLDTTHFSEAAATLLSLSTSSDVISSLTSYIASDPSAEAFMEGKPDQWGMKINPSYKNLHLPVSTWPQLDTWIPDTPGQACLSKNPAPYLPKVAAPVSTLTQIATAMILSWPNVQTVCDTDPVTGLFKLGRIAPQGVGSRFMLGLISLGDAARYGLPVASLQASPDHYVAPTLPALASSVRLATQQGSLGAFSMDQAKVRRSRSAYPGMLVVQTAARLGGMKAEDAAHVADFIDISSTEGQQPGRGNGQLPLGYLPILKSGSTAKLFAAAQRASAAIRAQKAGDKALAKSVTAALAAVKAASGSSGSVAAKAPAAVSAKAAKAADSRPGDSKIAMTSKTGDQHSLWSGLLLPLLIGLVLLGALGTGASRLALRSRGVS